jgi:hypothetical protein
MGYHATDGRRPRTDVMKGMPMPSLTLGKAQEMFVELSVALMEFTLDQGYQLRYGETYRPQEMQDLYYKRGSTKTKNSQHTKKLAVDLLLFKDGVYLTDAAAYAFMAEYWESLSPYCYAGIRITTLVDANHFELRQTPRSA